MCGLLTVCRKRGVEVCGFTFWSFSSSVAKGTPNSVLSVKKKHHVYYWFTFLSQHSYRTSLCNPGQVLLPVFTITRSAVWRDIPGIFLFPVLCLLTSSSRRSLSAVISMSANCLTFFMSAGDRSWIRVTPRRHLGQVTRWEMKKGGRTVSLYWDDCIHRCINNVLSVH